MGTTGKERADELVYRQGLAESREMAKRLIMAGKVALLPPEAVEMSMPEAGDGTETVADAECSTMADVSSGPLADTPAATSAATTPTKGATLPTIRVDKPGHKYPCTTRFVLTGIERFVSRGAYKLLTALRHFDLDVNGAVCLDAGASTGGFTDCLLQHGAARVYAVDVGHAQLHERLRRDPRVISREGVNLRIAPPDLLPEAVDFIVADLSFISLTLVLPACMGWLKPQGQVVALIKPQFELGPHQTDRGVVRDEILRQSAVDKVLAFCRERLDLDCRGVTPSAILGPKGNQEYLACFVVRGGLSSQTALEYKA